MNNVHFSSASDNWATPDSFFAAMVARFGPFDLDPAADAANAKAPKFFTREDDGLAQPWAEHGKLIWLNPPYGREIGKWVAKAVAEMQRGGGDGCVFIASPDGHAMVARIRHALRQDRIHPRAAQVWRLRQLGSLPFGTGNIRA